MAKKKTIIIYSSIVLGALVLGVVGGFVIKRATGQVIVDYGDFNPDDYKADASSLLSSYNANPKKSFTPAELVNIGLEKYRRCENSYSLGVGNAETIVTQTIRNAQIKNYDIYFEESISRSSFVPLANRSIQEGMTNGIKLNKGKAESTDVGSYVEDDFVSYSLDEYKTD